MFIFVEEQKPQAIGHVTKQAKKTMNLFICIAWKITV